MASPIAEAFVTIAPDFGKFDSELKSGLSKAETLADRAAKDIEASFDEAAKEAGDSFDGVGAEIEQSVDDIDIDVSDEFEGAGEDGGDSFLGGAGGIIKGGIAAIGVAAAAALTAGFIGALGRENVTAGLQASLGLTEEEAKQAGASAGRVYRDAWGDNLEQVSGVVESTIAGFGDLDDVELDGIVSQALAMEKAFGIDANEAINSASLAVTNGLAKDGTAALDLLTGSMQNLTPVVRDEVLAATNEYSKSFAQLGIDGPAAFGLLTKAGEQGIIGIDKAGDSIKEFTIRATDGSKSTSQAFDDIGLDAEEMGAAILAGGDEGAEAFDTIIAGLADMDDPFLQSQAAIALFGTPLEDLGTENIPDFIAALGGTGDELGNFEGSAQAAADVLGGTTTATFERFKRDAMGKLTDIVVNDVIPALLSFKDYVMNDVVPVLKEVWKEWKPRLDAIASFVTETILPAFQTLMDTVVPILKDVGDSIRSAFVWLINNKPVLVGVLAGITAAVVAFAATALPPLIIGFINWAAAAAAAAVATLVAAAPFIAIGVAIAAVVAGIIWAYQNFEIFRSTIETVVEFVQTAWPLVTGVFMEFVGWVVDILSPVIVALGELFAAVWDGIQIAVDIALNLIMGYIDFAIAFWTTAFEVAFAIITTMWDVFGETILGIVNVVFNTIKTIIESVMKVVEGIIQVVTGIISGNWSKVWEGIKNVLSGVWDGIKGIVEGAMGLIEGYIQVGLDAITAVWDTIWGGIKTTLDTIWTDIKLAVDLAITALTGFFDRIPDAIGTAISTVADVIKAPFIDAFNAVKLLWNNTVGGFGFSVPSWIPGVGGKGFNIPMMANGGYVDSPTLAMIGEAGPELVVPLNRPSRAEALLQGAGLTGVGGGPAVMIQSANFYDGTDADLVAQKTMLALSARRLTA